MIVEYRNRKSRIMRKLFFNNYCTVIMTETVLTMWATESDFVIRATEQIVGLFTGKPIR